VGLTVLTGDPVWDAIGTICIGVLLGVIAVILIIEMKSLLIGEGAAPQVLSDIVSALESGEVQRVIHIKTQYLGPEEMLVAAKIALAPGLPLEGVASAIDAAEVRVRERVPDARIIYLEPDLDRAALTG
jgi:divalent metal cation (Fe/Co/Zn/Cd) transporter